MGFQAVAAALERVEAELRRLDWLVGEVPNEPAHVESAFGHREMPFEHWLIRVLLPAARRGLAERNLPRSSQVTAVAIRNFDGRDEAAALIAALSAFDQAVEAAARRPE